MPVGLQIGSGRDVMQKEKAMTRAIAVLALLGLAACETGGGAENSSPPDAASGGVSVSGYARIGASHSF